MKKFIFVILGVLFGVVMYKAEAASWFRIYEMFKFQSFYMYGFIGTALIIGIIGFQFIKRKNLHDIDGKEIILQDKIKSVARYLIGGLSFGLGWALIGACPGPIFVLFGAGVYSMLIVIIFAIIGTFLYGIFRNNLPH